MKSMIVDTDSLPWSSAQDVFEPNSRYEGREVVQYKILADRREEGGGVTYLLRFSPPPGKLLKIIATAASDEHVYLLEGGYCDKTGALLRSPGIYGLNPQGKPHSAFVGLETIALVVYTGAPDEVHDFGVVEPVLAG
jgi:hypothetical protein